MAAVFTDCPATGRPIDTGIEIDEMSFDRLPSFSGKIFCPHCSIEHAWDKSKAWLKDADKTPP